MSTQMHKALNWLLYPIAIFAFAIPAIAGIGSDVVPNADQLNAMGKWEGQIVGAAIAVTAMLLAYLNNTSWQRTLVKISEAKVKESENMSRALTELASEFERAVTRLEEKE